MLGPTVHAPGRVKAEVDDYYFNEQEKHVRQPPWGQSMNSSLIKSTAMPTCILPARLDSGIRCRETVIHQRCMLSSDGEESPDSLDGGESVEELPMDDSAWCPVERIACKQSTLAQVHSSIGRLRKPSRKAKISPKEKDRAREFNSAFDTLRKRIPSIPASKKLSKIEILRLAISYMLYLRFLLNTDGQDLRHGTLPVQRGVPGLPDDRYDGESNSSPDEDETKNTEKDCS